MMRWKRIDPSNPPQRGVLEEYRDMSPYEILQVHEDASAKDVTAAYRRRIRTYHPDKSDEFLKSTNEEIAKLLNLAYEQIMREIHDRK